MRRASSSSALCAYAAGWTLHVYVCNAAVGVQQWSDHSVDVDPAKSIRRRLPA